MKRVDEWEDEEGGWVGGKMKRVDEWKDEEGGWVGR